MLTDKDILILRHIQIYGGITINQCYRLFYNHAKMGKDLARKRLKHLYDVGECKYTTLPNSTSQERLYYVTKPISTHSLLLLDFYSHIVYNGAEIIEFNKEVSFDNLRSDALMKFKWKVNTYVYFIEVVITNQVDYSKYENLKESGTLQRTIGTFPSLIIISNTPTKYKGSKLSVKYIDYKMNDFVKIVLP